MRLTEYFDQCAREMMEDEDVRLLHHWPMAIISRPWEVSKPYLLC